MSPLPEAESATPEAFAGRVDFPTGIKLYKMVAGDIDGDGCAGLVVANRGSHDLSIYRNTPALVENYPLLKRLM